MRVGQQSKRDVAAEMHERYIRASRGEEGRLVGELVGLTGYHGNHAKVPLKNGPPAGGVGPDLRRAGRPVEYGLDAGPGELVLGAESAAALFRTPAAAIGRTVTIREAPYAVVGVARAGAGGLGPPQAAASYLHADDARRLAGLATVGQIVAEARDAAAVDGAAAEIRAALVAAHGVEDFRVTTQRQLLATVTQITDLLTALLAGIAGISPVVGGTCSSPSPSAPAKSASARRSGPPTGTCSRSPCSRW